MIKGEIETDTSMKWTWRIRN